MTMQVIGGGEGGQMWRLQMKSGSVIGIWAGGYSKRDGNYVFDIYVEATEEEQGQGVVITGLTPAHPERVTIAVASIPIDDVQEIETTDWEKIPSLA